MKLKTLMMGTAMTALLAGSALAQAQTTPPEDGVSSERMQTAPAPGVDPTAPAATDIQAAPEPMSIEEMTVGQVIGTPVMTQAAEDVGEIDYVLIQPDGQAGAVIGIGGFLGLGEYTVLLPLSEFSYDPESRTLIVAKTEDELRATPEFDESDAESLDDDLLMADVIQSAEPADNATAAAPSAEEPSDAPIADTADTGETVTDPVADSGETVTDPVADSGETVTDPVADSGETMTDPVADAGEVKPAPESDEAVDSANAMPESDEQAGEDPSQSADADAEIKKPVEDGSSTN